MKTLMKTATLLILGICIGCGSVPPAMDDTAGTTTETPVNSTPEIFPVEVEEVPEGDEVNDEILSNPGQVGTILVIFAQDEQFLGRVNNNRFDSESLCNRFGPYGNRFSGLSIWNRFGTYGGDFVPLSAFNDLSSTPPILFDEVGALAYVTTNNIFTPRIDAFFLLNLLQANGCDVER